MLRKFDRRFKPIMLVVMVATIILMQKLRIGFGVPVTREWLLEHVALIYGLFAGWIIRSINIRKDDWS